MSAARATTVPPSVSSTSIDEGIPSIKALQNAAKLAYKIDKPILIDYYRESRSGTAFLGKDVSSMRDGATKPDEYLFKNKEEFTSPIQNKYRIVSKPTPESSDLVEYIFVTENSIYIIHGAISVKEISLAM